MKHTNKADYEKKTPSWKRDLPTDDFLTWWNPTSVDEISGVSIGGHPDAERVWVRKDPGRFTKVTYGCNGNIAWLCQQYREEYYRWVEAGRPEREPFRSECVPLEEAGKRMARILALIGL